MQKTKTISAASFLCVILLPILFWVVYFSAQQVNYYIIQEKLEKKQVVQITIHSKDVNWVKLNKEILIGQHLFDVKSYTVKGEIVTFFGIFDTAEDGIKLQLNKIENANTTNALPVHSLLLHLLSPTILTAIGSTIELKTTLLVKNYTSYHPLFLNLHYLKVATPPPNLT